MTRSSLLAAVVVAVAACGGDPEVEELRSFLTGEAVPLTDAGQLARLNEAFGRQAVRAEGFGKSGVTNVEEEGWSPAVVRAADGAVTPLETSAWRKDGTLDEQGRFAPKASERRLDLSGLGEELRALPDLDDRAALLAGALEPLGSPDVVFVARAKFALVVADGRAEVNPRLLALLTPQPKVVVAVADAPQPAGAGAVALRTQPAGEKGPGPFATEQHHGDFGRWLDAYVEVWKQCPPLGACLTPFALMHLVANDRCGICSTVNAAPRFAFLMPLAFVLGLAMLRRRRR